MYYIIHRNMFMSVLSFYIFLQIMSRKKGDASRVHLVALFFY